MIARFESTCQVCNGRIAVGVLIDKTLRGWRHTLCKPLVAPIGPLPVNERQARSAAVESATTKPTSYSGDAKQRRKRENEVMFGRRVNRCFGRVE